MRTVLILAVLSLAGAAHAETRAADVIARFKAQAPPALTLKPAPAPMSLASPDLFLKTAAERAPPARPAGTVQTAVDRSFTRSSSVVGSLGYLCGLTSGPNEAGGVASSHEPMSTFLGGQLHVSF